MSVAAIDPGAGQFWIEHDCAAQIPQGPLRLVFQQPCLAAIAMESRLLWIKRDGAVEIGERAVQIAHLLPRHPAIVPGYCEARVQFERPVAISDRLIHRALAVT